MASADGRGLLSALLCTSLWWPLSSSESKADPSCPSLHPLPAWTLGSCVGTTSVPTLHSLVPWSFSHPSLAHLQSSVQTSPTSILPPVQLDREITNARRLGLLYSHGHQSPLYPQNPLGKQENFNAFELSLGNLSSHLVQEILGWHLPVSSHLEEMIPQEPPAPDQWLNLHVFSAPLLVPTPGGDGQGEIEVAGWAGNFLRGTYVSVLPNSRSISSRNYSFLYIIIRLSEFLNWI